MRPVDTSSSVMTRHEALINRQNLLSLCSDDVMVGKINVRLTQAEQASQAKARAKRGASVRKGDDGDYDA